MNDQTDLIRKLTAELQQQEESLHEAKFKCNSKNRELIKDWNSWHTTPDTQGTLLVQYLISGERDAELESFAMDRDLETRLLGLSEITES